MVADISDAGVSAFLCTVPTEEVCPVCMEKSFYAAKKGGTTVSMVLYDRPWHNSLLCQGFFNGNII